MSRADPSARAWWRPDTRRRWFLIPIAIALAVLIATLVLAPGPPHADDHGAVPLVRVVEAAAEDVAPVLEGYGEIRAERTWDAVAQVPGRIGWRHPNLQPGARFAAGERLVEIDPQDYRVAVERAEAQLRSAAAALGELEAAARDLRVSREIEREALGIALRDFERREQLAAAGHIAAIELDAERQRLLRQRQTLQSLEAELNALPTRRESLQSRQREAELQLERARLDLARTSLALPFDGRIVAVNAELGQFVPAGQQMFSAATTERLEALLEVPLEQLLSRFPSALTPGGLDALRATLSWSAGDVAFQWHGRVVRVDPAMDTRSRAARVFVRLDDAPESMPAANVFARIEITGPAQPGRISLPRLAVADEQVWVVNADDRLERRSVRVAYRDDVRAVLLAGVSPGERVLVTQLPFAVSGMAVEIAPPP